MQTARNKPAYLRLLIILVVHVVLGIPLPALNCPMLSRGCYLFPSLAADCTCGAYLSASYQQFAKTLLTPYSNLYAAT